jgi:hypothetical protein
LNEEDNQFKWENAVEKNSIMQPVDMNELAIVEGGVGVGIYTGDQSKLIALQKNGASVSAPTLGGPNSYYPSGGPLQRGDGLGNPDYQEGKNPYPL